MAELEIITTVPRLPPRPVGGHKGTFGHVLVVAGSRGMSGAAVLCAGGAVRGGAGLVTVATAEPIQAIVAMSQPCALTVGLHSTMDGHLSSDADTMALAAAERCSVIAAGPGLGSGHDVADLIVGLLARSQKPMVLDADGLNVLGPSPAALRRDEPLVVTPHPGEFGRLTGLTTDEIENARDQHAAAFANQFQLIVVLKGAGTIVTDGRRLYRNTTGNPGMATGGSGDVLTGLIAALIGQGFEAFDAACLGVFVHGRAGDLARDSLGETSLIASDLLDYLPRATQSAARE